MFRVVESNVTDANGLEPLPYMSPNPTTYTTLTIHHTHKIAIATAVTTGTKITVKLSLTYRVAVLIIPIANLILLKMQTNIIIDNAIQAISQ